jgi:ubiquinone/menaquinone biosynthesis C-methylase UbiE
MATVKKEASANQWDQYRCPTGVLGRTVAASMNRGHMDLSTWGLKHVRVEPDFVVLDVGCGGGKTISRLAHQAFEGKVYGIDHSLDMVDYSRKVNQELVAQNRVEIVQGSVERTGFQEEFFDLVTAIETYYFWPNLPKAFAEIRRILKTGGFLLIISEMIKDGIYEEENAETIAKTHVRLLPLTEIQKILRSEGFLKVKVFKKPKSPWNAILAQKQ